MNESRDPGMQTATRLVSKGDQLTVLQVPRTRLVVLEGNQADEPYEVPAHGVLVGADPDCDLVLADLAVSRRHLTLTPCEQGIRLRDLNSKNGTRVSGVRVVEALLAGGEEIQLGNTRLQLQVVAGGRDEFPISSHTAFGSLLGRSPAMRRVFALLERAADSESTLLLEGESGTGKDLVAENTHRISPRKDGPFIVVDAGSMQANLAESELFGHRKGAFTGAESDRVGAFEAGGGGTVFIDEVGELPPELQPKLLRLL
jgi:two-component system response regulator GlrR